MRVWAWLVDLFWPFGPEAAWFDRWFIVGLSLLGAIALGMAAWTWWTS